MESLRLVPSPSSQVQGWFELWPWISSSGSDGPLSRAHSAGAVGSVTE